MDPSMDYKDQAIIEMGLILLGIFAIILLILFGFKVWAWVKGLDKPQMTKADKKMFKDLREEAKNNLPALQGELLEKPKNRQEQVDLIANIIIHYVDLILYLKSFGIYHEQHPLVKSIKDNIALFNAVKFYIKYLPGKYLETVPEQELENYTFYLLINLKERTPEPFTSATNYIEEYFRRQQGREDDLSNVIFQRHLNVEKTVQERLQRDRNAFDDFLQNAEGPPPDLKDNQRREHWEDEELNS